MNSNQIRQTFLDFFKSKQHQIVDSAPLVIKNDPTLMFTNAGMNQFKDLFLGNAPIKHARIADSQKCLRVSGKHNDLEEVGVDTYHHTMFEMLGNWSFGDYFKKEAIEWAWELLTEVYKLPKDRLYVTVFEGDAKENLAFDTDAKNEWKKWISEDRILNGNKKDNFWEMGDTGPCGPCSEIHIDMRSDEERKKVEGKTLVNNDHPQVIEIWNNVFMEFNRKADGTLESLPAKHVDTGMGFERLCRAIEGKSSNYDTDVFQPTIKALEKLSNIKYGVVSPSPLERAGERSDIAMRVIADHLRAVSFSIADGQLPSNNGAGYVIRRILRRAIRYGYQSLELKEPFIHTLMPILAKQMGEAFPELVKQQTLIEKVIKEEEISFYKTLERGLQKIPSRNITGEEAFELFDTYGFPIDLTQLIARESNFTVDMEGFNKCMQKQKTRSRDASAVDAADWVKVIENTSNSKQDFIGYHQLVADSKIVEYRKVKTKSKEQYQIVLDKTPFYAESGGQVGDTGVLENGTDKIFITDTKKENGVIIHFTDKLPTELNSNFSAQVNIKKRILTENNHSATHLLHAALRKVLGTHVEQKGSLVNEDYLRFDFSHFSKVTDEELAQIEKIVNEKIRENIPSDIKEMPIEEAKKLGAMALFGEKYGDTVRVVTFDKEYSIELCGGTHVKATGQIGLFKITSEAAVAAGIRRIEAITSVKAEEFYNQQSALIMELNALLKNPKDISKSLQDIIAENNALTKQIESFIREKANTIKTQLATKIKVINGINFISEKIELDSADAIKNLSFELRNQIQNLVLVIGAEVKDKPMISVIISDNLVKEKNMNAATMIRELAKEIQGGGGGQAFYATAGGNNTEGIFKALEKATSFIN